MEQNSLYSGYWKLWVLGRKKLRHLIQCQSVWWTNISAFCIWVFQKKDVCTAYIIHVHHWYAHKNMILLLVTCICQENYEKGIFRRKCEYISHDSIRTCVSSQSEATYLRPEPVRCSPIQGTGDKWRGPQQKKESQSPDPIHALVQNQALTFRLLSWKSCMIGPSSWEPWGNLHQSMNSHPLCLHPCHWAQQQLCWKYTQLASPSLNSGTPLKCLKCLPPIFWSQFPLVLCPQNLRDEQHGKPRYILQWLLQNCWDHSDLRCRFGAFPMLPEGLSGS